MQARGNHGWMQSPHIILLLESLCGAIAAGGSAVSFEVDRGAVLQALSAHIGKARGITAKELVAEITWEAATDAQCRKLRMVIEELRREGQHICGHPASGYFIAANEDELNETCRFLVDRAMTTLTQVSRMKKASLPDLHGQLGLKI